VVKVRKTNLPDLSALAIDGARIAVRATPKAARNEIQLRGDQILVRVTAPAADGQANAAVQKLLAKSLGIAPSRFTLLQGAQSRDKLFLVG
jgi:uncharacterized protein YggU (UPF0235/DUF167 family)